MDFGVGLGNAVSFGAGGLISEWWNGAGSFDRESDAFSYGEYAGMIGGGLGGVGKGALNYARTTFTGTAQSTGTLGHAFVSKLIGYSAAINNPNVVRVGFDVGYKRALEGLATITYKYGPRPDVLLGYKNGTIKVIEVASRSDKITKLFDRNKAKIAIEQLDGSVNVNKLALRLDKLFGG